jgi:hypothetical protein
VTGRESRTTTDDDQRRVAFNPTSHAGLRRHSPHEHATGINAVWVRGGVEVASRVADDSCQSIVAVAERRCSLRARPLDGSGLVKSAVGDLLGKVEVERAAEDDGAEVRAALSQCVLARLPLAESLALAGAFARITLLKSCIHLGLLQSCTRHNQRMRRYEKTYMCAEPGCHELLFGRPGKCKLHGSARHGSDGHGSQWRRTRNAYIREHPRCEQCGKPAREVHHRDHRGPPGPHGLDWTKLEALCVPRHRRVTRAHEKRMRQARAISAANREPSP